MLYMCMWCWQNLVHLMFFCECQWPNKARVIAHVSVEVLCSKPLHIVHQAPSITGKACF